MNRSVTRRDFLKTGAAVTALNLLPSHAWAQSPNGKLRTAHIGVGGMGNSDLTALASHPQVEVAAMCDVDLNNLNTQKAAFPDARCFRDYRELFAAMADSIDAVVVSTPDHTHAPVAMTALQLGKPVYCQKPLTHEIYEARQLKRVARRKGVATQMGIQVHSHVAYRMATQFIQSGVIGKVSKVFAWSFKDWGYDGGAFEGEDPVPEFLDWDQWLGVTETRPYKQGVYHPSNWRKLIDFGTGTLGDMGVHIFDTPYRALKLTAPNWVKTSCRVPTGIGHPSKNIVRYEFPATEFCTDKMLWTWYDGAHFPPEGVPELEMPEERELPNQGAMFIGEEGRLLLPHVGGPQLFPLEKFRTIDRPKLPAVDHYHSWVDACLGKGKTSAHFGYAGPLTEALLLGVVANRFPDQKLDWDARNLRVTNLSEANQFVRRTYRAGFEVKGLS